MFYPASAFIRAPVFWAVTLGLGLAYLGSECFNYIVKPLAHLLPPGRQCSGLIFIGAQGCILH